MDGVGMGTQAGKGSLHPQLGSSQGWWKIRNREAEAGIPRVTAPLLPRPAPVMLPPLCSSAEVSPSTLSPEVQGVPGHNHQMRIHP